MKYYIIGDYSYSLLLKIVDVIKRTLLIIYILLNVRPDVVVSFGSISLNYASFFLRIPSLTFEDDFEYKLGFYPYIHFTNKIIIPEVFDVRKNNKKFIKYRGFKELAYLHKKYFTPNDRILTEYSLKEKKYVFFRIAQISPNYKDRSILKKIDYIIDYVLSKNYEIVLSIEDKTLLNKYKYKYIVLNEPIKDFYSILYYAKLLISTGDTMARESCILGTPSIFIGGRNMLVNKTFKKMNMLFEVNDFEEFIASFDSINLKKNDYYLKKRDQIINQFDDTTEVIIKNIIGFK